MRKIDATLMLAGAYFSVLAPAFGHVDPFYASIIVQAMIGVIAFWLFFGRAWFDRVRTDARDRHPIAKTDSDIRQPE